MKYLIIIFMTMNAIAVGSVDIRTKIGPTFMPPILKNDTLYFLSTTGVLFNSKKDFSELKIVAKASAPSMSALSEYKNYLVFGDGLHTTKRTKLYFFNTETNKIEKELEFNGHIERAPLINEDYAYVGLGEGGVSKVDLKEFKIIKNLNGHKKLKFHIDSTPVKYKSNICAASQYHSKGIVCFNRNMEFVKFIPTKYSPKSVISLKNNKLFGFATEGSLMSAVWDVKSQFYVIDLDQLKITVSKELRGFTFFRPLELENDEFAFGISTGDLLTINISTGKIGFIGQFTEPFISNPFNYKKSICFIGIMGKLLCYKKASDRYNISIEKRYYESPIGTIKTIGNKVFLPSRIGYFTL